MNSRREPPARTVARKSKVPAIPGNRTPDALKNLTAWFRGLPRYATKAGAEFKRTGQVGDPNGTIEHLVNARVGVPGDDFDVTLFCTRGQWSAACGCDHGPICGHSAALALVWLDRNARAQDGADSAPAEKPRAFTEVHAPIIEGKLGRPLRNDELRALAALEMLHRDVIRHQGRLLASAVKDLGFRWFLRKNAPDWEPVLDGWWNHAQPPATPLELWQYLAYDLERRGEVIPELFQPLTDTGAVRARLESKLLQETVNRWQFQLRRLAEPERHAYGQPQGGGLEGITGLRVSLQDDGTARLQTRRGAEAAWKPATATFIRSLPYLRAVQLREFSPAEAALARAGIGRDAGSPTGSPTRSTPGRRRSSASTTAFPFRCAFSSGTTFRPTGLRSSKTSRPIGPRTKTIPTCALYATGYGGPVTRGSGTRNGCG